MDRRQPTRDSTGVNASTESSTSTKPFWYKLNDMDRRHADPAGRIHIDMHERFEHMVISHRGHPARRFLVGFPKFAGYANKPQLNDSIKVSITNAITQM